MKTLTKYLNEKLVIFPSQVDEKLVINKSYKDGQYTCTPKTFDELRKIIEDRYKKLGHGTKQNPIDFNDVDVSNIESFYCYDYNLGLFEDLEFEYIDISDWDVSNVENMKYMFQGCTRLRSVGDLLNWDVSNAKGMYKMFYCCEKLKSVGDLSGWNVSKVEDISFMFYKCKQLKSVGDLSNWNVSKVENVNCMFGGCTEKIIPYWYYKL